MKKQIIDIFNEHYYVGNTLSDVEYQIILLKIIKNHIFHSKINNISYKNIKLVFNKNLIDFTLTHRGYKDKNIIEALNIKLAIEETNYLSKIDKILESIKNF